MAKKKQIPLLFDKFSGALSKIAGGALAFPSAFVLVMVWVIFGFFFHFSDSWQLIMDTTTSIITFLMVFVIQQAQNKDTMALQLKLNELIAATKGASNRVINIEDMTEEELRVLKNFYSQLSALSEKEGNFGTAHSVDEAKKNEAFKEKVTAES